MALIAAKQLELAKTRLAGLIPAAERKLLAEAMFRDVLAAALASREAQRVAVVSSDAQLLRLARREGALVLDEELPRGLNRAVRLATAALGVTGAGTICTLLSDIPLVTAEDIDLVFRIGERKSVVLVPSRDTTGTNMLCRSPGDVIETRFGGQSLARHLAQCASAGITHEIVALERPAIDLDLMADLAEFMRFPGNTHTFNQLARLGLAQG